MGGRRVYWGLVRTRSRGLGSHYMELRLYPEGSGDPGVRETRAVERVWWVNRVGLFMHGKITAASEWTVMRVLGRVRAAVVIQAGGEGRWAQVPVGGMERVGQI